VEDDFPCSLSLLVDTSSEGYLCNLFNKRFLIADQLDRGDVFGCVWAMIIRQFNLPIFCYQNLLSKFLIVEIPLKSRFLSTTNPFQRIVADYHGEGRVFWFYPLFISFLGFIGSKSVIFDNLLTFKCVLSQQNGEVTN